MMTADLPEAPPYFPLDVALNRAGAAPLRDHPLPPALNPEMAARLEEQGATFLDVRPAPAFGAGHVPASVNIGLSGQFASWAGTLLPAGPSLLIVGEDEAGVSEAVMRLARVGLENVAGYLEGGVAAWDRAGRPVGTLPQIAVDELRARVREGQAGLQVVDVRRPGEYAAGHVPGALSRPLDRLEREVGTLDRARPTAVICAGGYRSSAATSLLRRGGFTDVSNVVGGTSAWIAAGYEVETPAGGPKTGP
jgi:rhodanese-related sulfurtransferase